MICIKREYVDKATGGGFNEAERIRELQVYKVCIGSVCTQVCTYHRPMFTVPGTIEAITVAARSTRVRREYNHIYL